MYYWPLVLTRDKVLADGTRTYHSRGWPSTAPCATWEEAMWYSSHTLTKGWSIPVMRTHKRVVVLSDRHPTSDDTLVVTPIPIWDEI